MSVAIIDQQDERFGTSGDGSTTFERIIIYEGDSMMEIASSKLYPQRGTRHPENTVFYLDTIDVEQIGNKNRRVQARAKLTYSNGSALVRDFTGDPWDLGAQNVRLTPVSEQKPLLKLYNELGEEKELKNGAGMPILAETSSFYYELSFKYCVRANSSGEFDGNEEPVLNKGTEKVAGIRIPARCGLLMPLSADLMTEHEGANDEVKRRYWEVQAVIKIKSSTWEKKFLNVGTMAVFKDGDGPQQIYEFNKLTGPDDVASIQNAAYGPIATVLKYRKQFIANGGDAQNFPYDEITEPLPLTAEGHIFTEALIDPKNNKYQTISGYEFVPSSWNKYDLPTKRA